MRLPVLLGAALLAAASWAHGGDVSPASPFGLASRLEARLAAGDGVAFPDAEREFVRFAGVVDLSDGDWPAEFLAKAGQTVCVAVSPVTGCYEFFEESGSVFWTVVPVLPTTDNWVAPFRHAEEGSFPDDDLYAPWRLVDVWKLSFGESEVLRGGASRRAPRRLPPGDDPATNLCFMAFSYSATNLFFTAAWSTNDTLPEAMIDLYGSTNLSSRWTFLSSHPTTTNPVSFSIECDSLPWYVAPTQHVHDATCESVTNIVASPLDGTTVYTNVFWSCATNRMPGEAGFFRLGTRHDTDGDGIFDAAELLVLGTDPSLVDTDGDGAPDGVDPAVWALSHPMWTTNGQDPDFVVELVAPEPTNTTASISVGGLSGSFASGAPLYFSLPPGQIVPCTLSNDSFLILWCGTSGGSFWGIPESFERPFWTSGIRNVSGYHETGGSCEIAVPVLSVEPDFDGGLRSGSAVESGSHLTASGSVCVHGDTGFQRYSWSLAPSVAGTGRQPFVTGAVRLEGGFPVIDVAGTTGEQTGTFGFGPGYDSSGGLLWGSLTNVLAAHRCDATYESPFCSVCGHPCYDYASDHDVDYLTIIPEENDYYHLARTIVHFPGSQQRVFREWKNPDPDLHQPIFYCDAQSLLQEPLVFAEPMAYMETEAHMTPDETPDPEDCSWRCVAGLPSPIPELGSGVWSDFHVPLHGGVFKFRFSCAGLQDSDAFLVLPLAGASVDDIVEAEIAAADAFAQKVLLSHTLRERNSREFGMKCFFNNGAGDCRGRPDNAASPTVRFYNEVSNANGFGAVCTWNGKCVRLAKISNFLVAYACQKIGVRAFLQDLSQWSGTRNGDSAVVSWDCGVDLANGTKTLVECARWIGNTSWREGDEKLMKLWPNPASADNFAEPDSIVDYDTQFTIPGFLRMEDP